MSSSILRSLNSTNIPLLANGIFLGQAEFAGSLLSVLVNCYADTEIKVEIFEYSTPALTVAVPISVTTIPALTYKQIEADINFPYVKLVVTNMAATNQNQLNINTVYTNLLPLGAGLLDASGNISVSVDGVVDVSGNVVATNLITETLATRRVDFLVVGNWYRVASVGLTTGAEWQVISGGTACVGGQSVPDIGRLFKCVVAGPAVQNGGECYDVEYTDSVSATITNFPSFPAVQPVSGTVSLTDPTSVRIRDSYGDLITTTAGNLMVGINNIYTANPLHTIVDSGPATQAVTGTFFQATQPVSIASSVAVTGSFYPAVQDVSGTFFQATQPVSIATLPSLATGTNSIGKVSEITNTVTTRITNSVYTNARDIALSNTGHVVKASAGTLRGITCSNTDNTAYAYVKIYDKATTPTSADTPICTLPVYKNALSNVDFFNLEMTSGISLRATLNLADNDNTAVSGMVVFVSYDGI